MTVIVCEWEPVSQTSREDVCRTKMRFEIPPNFDGLMRHLEPVIGAPELYNIELYDTEKDEYVPVTSNLLDDGETDTASRLGKIWRVRATPCRHDNLGAPALPGRVFSEEFGYPVEGGVLKINENHNQQDTTCTTVWDGAVLLADYLKADPSVVRGKNVLELGSGVGLVGLVSACLGAKYVELTDLPEAVHLLSENTKLNKQLWRSAGCDAVTCTTLDWFDPTILPIPGGNESASLQACWNVILLGDCVWTLDLVEPLINTLRALIDQYQARRIKNDAEPQLELLISYQRRGQPAHESFWSTIYLLFDVEKVNTVKLGIGLPNPKLLLRRCTPRQNV